MADSRIDWTDKVWNPTTGCNKGCSYCYARTMAGRLQLMGQEKYAAGFAPCCHPTELGKPLYWKKPRRIFVNSMGDLFDPAIPFEFIDRVMATINACPQHTFQILTKYSERMQQYFALDNPISNLWLGVTITCQEDFHRWWDLYYTNAVVRFISFEPLTGPIRFDCLHCHGKGYYDDNDKTTCPMCDGSGELLDRLDWAIVGGMTGKDAIPMHLEWVQHIMNKSQAAAVPFFFKQWGEWLPTASANYVTEKGWVYGKAEGRAILRDGRQVYLDLGPDARFKTIDAAAAKDLAAAMKANRIDPLDPDKFDWLGYHWLHRVGKKSAGALIDGKEWKQFPGEI